MLIDYFSKKALKGFLQRAGPLARLNRNTVDQLRQIERRWKIIANCLATTILFLSGLGVYRFAGIDSALQFVSFTFGIGYFVSLFV